MNNNIETFEQIIQDIENCNPQIIDRKSVPETFQLCNEPALSNNLSGNVGAYVVRALLRELGVDEHHVMKWRMEHKYRQYQILNYYLPGCMPETFSVSQILNETNGADKVRFLCSDGYFVKASLGDSSGRERNFDRTTDLEQIINLHNNGADEDDKWILQKKLNILKEFRVHTFNKDVLYGLTMLMTDLDSSYVTDIDEVINPMLERLPASILTGTLIGWDIAITDNYKIFIIEANFTGYHTTYHPGFQTSGFFGDIYYGSILSAWLNNYFRNKYNLSISSVEAPLLLISDYLREFMFYNQLFNKEQWDYLETSRRGEPHSAIIYLGDDINCRVTKLLDFFQLGNFAKTYYLIVLQESFFSCTSLFSRNKLLKVISEHNLFDEEELKIITKLSSGSREEECCRRQQHLLSNELCFNIRMEPGMSLLKSN